MRELEAYFGIRAVYEEYYPFEYQDHYGAHDLILYPRHLYREELFRRDLKFLLRRVICTLLLSTKCFRGNLRIDLDTMLAKD